MGPPMARWTEDLDMLRTPGTSSPKLGYTAKTGYYAAQPLGGPTCDRLLVQAGLPSRV